MNPEKAVRLQEQTSLSLVFLEEIRPYGSWSTLVRVYDVESLLTNSPHATSAATFEYLRERYVASCPGNLTTLHRQMALNLPFPVVQSSQTEMAGYDVRNDLRMYGLTAAQVYALGCSPQRS